MAAAPPQAAAAPPAAAAPQAAAAPPQAAAAPPQAAAAPPQAAAAPPAAAAAAGPTGVLQGALGGLGDKLVGKLGLGPGGVPMPPALKAAAIGFDVVKGVGSWISAKADEPIQTKFKYLFEPILVFGKYVMKLIAKSIVFVPRAIMSTQAFLWSLMLLGVMVMVMAIVAYLLYYTHPRPFFISRFVNMNNFINRFYDDVMRCLNVVVRRGLPGSLGNFRALADTVTRIASIPLNAPPNFHDNLDTYMRFRETLRNLRSTYVHSYMSKLSLRNTEMFLGENGEYSMDKVNTFRRNFLGPMDRLGDAVRRLSDALSTQYTPFGPGQDPAAYAYKSAVIELNLLLNDYMPRALRLMAVRAPPSRPLNFIILQKYYAPLVSDIITNGLVYGFVSTIRFYGRIWAWMDDAWGQVGMFISRLPCLLAPDHQDMCSEIKMNVTVNGREYFSEPENKLPTCSRTLHSYNVADSQVLGEAGEARAEVREGFGSVISLAKSIAGFFRNFAPLGYQIITYGKKFTQDPLMAIVGWLQILFSPILMWLILCWYMLMTIPVPVSIIWLIITVISNWTSIFYFWFSWFARFLFCFGLFLVFFALWVADMCTGGLVLKLMQCEDDVDAVEFRSDYVEGNNYERGFTGCMYPCFTGYVPTAMRWLSRGNILCTRRNASRPRLCPHQQLLRVLRQKGMTRPYSYDKYRPSPLFRFKALSEKYQEVRAAFHDRVNFLNGCDRNLQHIKGIARHVCSNIDANFYSNRDRKTAMTLCSQVFCSTPSNPADYTICHQLNADKLSAEGSDQAVLGEEPTEILGRSFMIGAVAIIVLIAAIALMRSSQARSAAVAQ